MERAPSEVSFDTHLLPKSSLSDTQRSLKRLFGDTSIASPVQARSQTNHAWTTFAAQALPSPREEAGSVFVRPLGRFVKNPDGDLREKLFGPTSLECIVLSIKDDIAERLGSQDQKMRECALKTLRKVDSLIARGQEENIKHGSSPTAPPFAILDAMIDPFFSTLNPQFPIWTKKSFTRMATALRQSRCPEQDWAAVTCCNNLILMTLADNSLRSRRTRPVQSKHTHRTSSIDSDFTAGCIMNAKRAIEHMQLKLSPRIIDVQATLSLVCSWLKKI